MKFKNRWKEDVVCLAVVMLFVLGFFALLNFGGVTGAIGLGNESFSFDLPVEKDIVLEVNSLKLGEEVNLDGMFVKKVEDDVLFDVNFSSIVKEEDYFIFEFNAGDYNNSLDVWIEFVDENVNVSETLSNISEENLSLEFVVESLQNYSNFENLTENAIFYDGNITENLLNSTGIVGNSSSNATLNATLNATPDATEMGTVLGLDSGADFEVCFSDENGVFDCFRGSGDELLERKATMMEWGNITVKIGLQNQKVPNFLLHVGNNTETFEFGEDEQGESFGFGTEEVHYTIGPSSSDSDPVDPVNNSRLQDTRHINFTYYINKTDGVHNDSNKNNDVVGNWWFEQNASDISGLGHDFTWVNADENENASGIVGYGYYFDGSDDDYLQVPVGADGNSLNFTWDDPFSFSLWMYRNESTCSYATSIRGIIGLAYTLPWNFHWQSGTDCSTTFFRIRMRDQDENTRNILYYDPGSIHNEWHHFVGTRKEGSSWMLYHNGIAVDGPSTAYNMSHNYHVNNLYIGYAASDRYFQGKIDEVMIFNRTLSALEVNEIYNRTLNIANRSLLLNIDGAGYHRNKTDVSMPSPPVGKNDSLNITFDYGEHNIYWKIATRELNDSSQWNSSEFYLEVNQLVTQSKPNIGSHAFVDPDYVVGQWRFEENGSGAIDETGLNNGSFVGDVKWCPDEGDSQKWNCSGRVGKGVMFDGVDDYIDVADSTSLRMADDTFSINFWMKLKGLGVIHNLIGTETTIGSTKGWVIRVSATNNLEFYVNNGSASDDIRTFYSGVNANTWYHVTGVIDGINNLLYVDGNLEDSTALNGRTDFEKNFGIEIGNVEVQATRYTNGTIDEVTIWNRSLSSEEVAQLYYSSAESYNSTYTIQDISASNNNTADLDNDTIKFIYDWYVNNNSMAVLNMPFEAVNNGSEQNFSRDYSGNKNHASITSFNQQSFSCKGSGSTRSCSGWNRTGGVDGFGAYEFDGIGDYIDAGTIDITDYSEISWGHWIKTNDTGVFVLTILHSGSDDIRTYVSGDSHCAVDDGTAYTASLPDSIHDENWHYIFCTFNGSRITSYLDGSLFDSTDGASFDFSTSDGSTSIGARGAGTLSFNGTIDEVLIFNRSLSAEQVLALYRNQTQTIKSSETVKGQSWKAEVTANDGYGDSIAYNTSEIVLEDVTLTIHNVYPKNLTTVQDQNPLSFTYNVSDGSATAGVMNCSLFLAFEDGNLVVNKTDRVIEVEVNQSMNLTFDTNTTHDIKWKIGCYDKDNEQTNSTEGVFTLQRNELVTQSKPNIGAHAFYDRDYVVMQHRFERKTSNGFVDYTGKNNGTISGDVKWCPDDGDSQKWNCSGRVGKGVMGDGVAGSYVDIGDKSSLDMADHDLTVSAWINVKKSGHNFAVTKLHNTATVDENTWGFEINGDEVNAYIIGSSVITKQTASNRIGLNEWHHVVVSYDRDGDMSIYIDGNNDANEAISGLDGEDLSSNYKFLIGGRDYTGTATFNGTIDEVTIWNRSLSATEVSQLYYSSAVSYNSTYTIQDISASNNNTGDLDNDTIKYIYDWYVNNKSMAVLNMPFEAVNNGSEMNFSRDYSDNENHVSVTSFNQQSLDSTKGSGWNRTGGVDGFGAYEFDGAGDYIEIADDNSLDYTSTSPKTVSMWFNLDDTSGTQTIISKWAASASTKEWLLYTSGTTLTLGVNTESTEITGTVAAGQWYHMVFVLDTSGNSELFLDGGSQGTGSATGFVASPVNTIKIGQNADSNWFDGTIDEVFIFNRTLSSEQILALYRNQTQTIKSQETVKGQSWKAEVTANDGYGDSIAYNTSEIVLESVTLEVHSIYPENLTVIHDTNQINFTYNVSDAGSVAGVMNCSLFLGYGGSHANNINKTDNIIEVEINQSFNITFIQNITHEVRWLVGCYDKDNEQINSTEGVITFQRNELVTQSKPNIGAHAFYDRDYVVMQHRFERKTSNGFVDYTGKNNGTISGDVKWCPDDGDSQKWNCSGRVGKGVLMNFDQSTAANGFVTCGDFVIMTDGSSDIVTGSAWIKSATTSYAAAIGILAKRDEFNFGVTDTDDFTIQTYGGNMDSVSCGSIDTNWHHMVWIYDEGNNKGYIYQDGSLLCEGTLSNDSPDTAYNFRIGSHAFSGGDSHFNGTIDEVTIWNRSLSETEIQQLYFSSAESYNSTYIIQDISASNNNTADLDNDTIKYIYDWYVNNESMAVLNMPFEAVNNGSEMNFSRDYSDNENHASITSFNQQSFSCKGSGSTRSCSGWNRTGGYDGFGAYEFDGAGDYINISDNINISGNFAVSFWVKIKKYGLADVLSKWDGTSVSHIFLVDGINYIRFYVGGAAVGNYAHSGSGLIINRWYHIVGVYDGTDTILYRNGIRRTDATSPLAPDDFDYDTLVGIRYDGSRDFNGTIDEVLIFNRSLSSQQVLALYRNQTHIIKSQETQKGESWKAEVIANDGYGDSIAYNTSEIVLEDVTLEVDNQAPINYYNSSTSSVNFTYNVSDNDATAGIQNCSLWLLKTGSWERNLTKTDYVPGDGSNLTFNITIQDISLNWTIACYDKDREQTNSSIYNLTVDTIAPNIQLNFPFNNTNSSTSYINFTYNVSTSTASIKNCSLYLLKNNVWQLNKTDILIEEEVNQTINITLEESSVLWKVGCYDSALNQDNSSSKNITIDTSAPVVRLQAPTDGTTYTDVWNIDFIYNVTSISGIRNCTLYLNIDDANYSSTDYDTTIAIETNQTINHIFEPTTQNVKWKIGCYSEALLQGNSSKNDLTLIKSVSAVVSAPVADTHRSTSSGSGRYVEREPSDITEVTTSLDGNVYSFEEMVPGETELEISNPNLAVTKLIIDTSREAKDIMIDIKEFKRTNLSKPKGCQVYRYFKIDSNIPKSVINKLKIIFKVGKHMGENITLLRYTYDWFELPTEKINEKGNYNYYQAESLGFSTFAICSDRMTSITAEKLEEAFAGFIKPVKRVLDVNKYYWLIIIPGILFLVLIIEFIIYRKLGHKPEHIKKIEKGIKKIKKKIKKIKIPKKIKEVVEDIKEQIPVEQIRQIFVPQPKKIPPEVIARKILNKEILRFNKLLKYITIDISMDKLDLATTRYKELLVIYKDLIKKAGKENKIKLYEAVEQAYISLKRALKIGRRKPR